MIDKVSYSLGLPLWLAKRTLEAVSQADREKYARVAIELLERWKQQHGEIYETGERRRSLLNPETTKLRSLTIRERQSMPPWDCAGPWNSALGLLFHLWISGHPVLRKVNGASENGTEFDRMLAALLLSQQHSLDYSDARQAADYLTISALSNADAKPLNIKRILTNKANASKPRKSKELTAEELAKFRERFRRRNNGKERGWQKAAAIEYGLSEAQIGRRKKKAALAIR